MASDELRPVVVDDDDDDDGTFQNYRSAEYPTAADTMPTTYLGLDFSTQQLKGVIVDDSLYKIFEATVHYDTELQEFRTHGGVIKGKDKQHREVTAPTVMWVKALDVLLDRLQVCGADLSTVAAVSGSGQQHGTVYWTNGSEKTLNTLNPSGFLHTQLASCFSIVNSPVWMDSSTTKQCKNLEEAVGGPQQLANITGSKAYERFSGPQIAKMAENKPGAYQNTERISLVSSFGCTLFLGEYAPIDWSDGSGMNLLDIKTKMWSEKCLEACAPELESRLGTAVPAGTDLGPISNYYVERFGFSSECRVVSFTGDNPASLAGLCLKKNDIAISLGTSDTLFLSLDEPRCLTEGHVLVSPINRDAYMVLLCFKNGSLTRERLRNHYANESWDHFNTLLERTPRGNFGYLGLYYDEQEIIPWIQGDYRFDKNNEPVDRFPSREIEIKALIEGQFIAKRAHAEHLGYTINDTTRIIATGGASANNTILQILSDVFNAPVYTQEAANSAVLGAAYQAKYGFIQSKNSDYNDSFQSVVSTVDSPKLACSPHKDAYEIYTPMVERYNNIIKDVLSETVK